MPKSLRLLDQVHIAAPCPADWEDMTGDDRVRHCSLCRLNVYNLSEMSAEEAESLLQQRTGRICVRFFVPEDGKVTTKDCPRGVRALRIQALKRVSIAASFVLAAMGCGTESSAKFKKAIGLDKFEKPPVAIAGAIPMPIVTTTATTPIPTLRPTKATPIPTAPSKHRKPSKS